MKGWSFLKIKDYPIQIIDGDRGANYPTKEEFLEDGHCLFLNTGNVTLSGFKFDEKVFVTEEKHKKLRKGHLQRGDIVLTTRGTIGNVAFYDESIKYDVIRINSGMLILRPDLNKLNAQFFYGLVRSSIFQQQADLFRYGAAQPQLPIGTLNHIRLPLPPLPTQKKIAGILSAYDDLIENNLRRIKLLEEMAQITYEEWFVRLRFPGHTTTPINEATGLPEGWKKVRLGDMCHLTMGQSPKSEFYNTDGNGLPFHQGVKDYGERFPSNESWSTEGARYAERGDVLFSVRAPVGRLNIALEKMILGRGLAAICHKQKAQGFLYCLLKKQFFAEDMMGGGAIFNSVTKNDMLRIDVVQPDENTLQKFNQIVSASDREIEVLHIQNQHLREARDILLPRLMTGVIDAEKYQPENFLKKN